MFRKPEKETGKAICGVFPSGKIVSSEHSTRAKQVGFIVIPPIIMVLSLIKGILRAEIK